MQEYWLPMNALTAIMFPVLAFFEITRLQGFRKTGKVRAPDTSLFLHAAFGLDWIGYSNAT